MNKIALIARIPAKDEQGKPTWVGSTWRTVRRLKSGEPKYEADFAAARFGLRYATPDKKQVIETLPGHDWQSAVAVVLDRERARDIEKLGGTAPERIENRKTVDECAKSFIEYIQSMSPSTYAVSTVRGYRRVVLRFCEMFGTLFMDSVTRDHIAKYVKHIETERPTRNGNFNRQGMVRTELSYLCALWLHEVGEGKFPLPREEWPEKVIRKAKAFTDAELTMMLSKATDDETDLIWFFVCTGFRDDEAAHTYYTDIDFTNQGAVTINVSAKPEWGFRIKNQKTREAAITLPSDFVARIKARRQRNPEGDLIFPNKNGRPKQDLLEMVRRAARRGGVEIEIGTGLHKFRKTFATRYAKKFGVRAAQLRLGHSNIKTTERYLADEQTDTQDVNDIFAGVGK